MILGVNGIRLIGKRSGVGRAIEAILRCMGELEHPFREIRVYTPEPLAADVTLPACAANVVVRSHLPPALWEQIALPKAHGNRGVLFCPSYVIPFFARCPTFLIHHGSYEGYPQAFGWWTLHKAWFAYAASARRAGVVCTVSECSRRDMARFYRINAGRIRVIPEGVDTRVFRPLEDRQRADQWRAENVGAPFLAYVGKPTERRNLSPLIRAFAALKRREKIPHKLVIVGADLPGASPFRQLIDAEGLSREVLVRGYASHQEMPLIYNAAEMLVYPSSYEGFGMPVLEAMACGTPVIALNNTAFPEFAGGIAMLLEDAGVQTLHQGILSLLNDAPLRARMACEGPRRAAAYDWRRITQRYLDLLIPLAMRQQAGAP